MNVVFTVECLEEIKEIAETVAEQSPRYAASFIGRLRRRCKALGKMPRRFPVALRHETSAIRKFVIDNYLVFYTVGKTQVDILHVIYGSREYETLLAATIPGDDDLGG